MESAWQVRKTKSGENVKRDDLGVVVQFDAEAALRGTNTRFRLRFDYVETGAKKQARQVSDLTLDEMEALWQEAKSVSDENSRGRTSP